MFQKWALILVPVPVLLFAAGEQAWKDKAVPEWTDDDAQQVLKDSPWVRAVKPSVDQSKSDQPSSGGRRGGGFGIPGMGRRGGFGYPGGGYPGGGYPGGGGGYPGGGRSRRNDDQTSDLSRLPTLKLRWESALPIREAELKARDTDAPTLDQEHYAIAVYGVPHNMASGDSKNLGDQLKKQASLKRDGKKELKPSSVEVLHREDGPVIVYLFPRKTEITRDDRRLEFDAKIGRLDLSESFYTEDMVFQNKLEL